VLTARHDDARPRNRSRSIVGANVGLLDRARVLASPRSLVSVAGGRIARPNVVGADSARDPTDVGASPARMRWLFSAGALGVRGLLARFSRRALRAVSGFLTLITAPAPFQLRWWRSELILLPSRLMRRVDQQPRAP